MKKKKSLSSSKMRLSWLPIHPTIIPPLFSFGHVRGMSKFFLEVEMILATCIVLGTVGMVIVWTMHVL